MKKRFIVCLNSVSFEQNEEFREFIKENRISWWHWLKNIWLLIDNEGELTARRLTEVLNKTYPNVHKLIFELRENGDTWGGYGPSGEKRNMFNWLKKYWKN